MTSAVVNCIAQSLRLPLSAVRHCVFTAPLRYKTYAIKKRNGKDRTIAQPARDIKLIQRFMVAELLEKMPVHDCAFAYVKGKGIRANAERHCHSSFILKLDFKDFFPSIKPDDLLRRIAHKIDFAFSVEDRRALSHLFFWKPRRSIDLQLSVGAPSSPIISNIVMYEFDNRVNDFCISQGISYTRYADDLCFSTTQRNLLCNVHDFVLSLLTEIESPRLVLNSDKTINVSKKYLRTVTGLVITPTGNVSLGRERKRTIRVQVDYYKKGTLPDDEFSILQGWIAYAFDVEPKFINNLLTKLDEPERRKLFPRQLG